MSKNVGIEVIKATLTGTAAAVASKQTFVSMFTLVAPSGNSGTVFVGDSSVSSTQCLYQLSAGDSVVVELPKNAAGQQIKLNLETMYVQGTTSDTLSIGHFNC